MNVFARPISVTALLIFMLFVSVNSTTESTNNTNQEQLNTQLEDSRVDLKSSNYNSTTADHRSNEDALSEHAVDNPDEIASLVNDISTHMTIMLYEFHGSRYSLYSPQTVYLKSSSIQNSTSRRNLGYFSCGTGNPIDDCWRCDPNWQYYRKRLANCVIGFGRNAVGGRDGKYYIVTDPSDDDPVNPRPGTLRYAVIQDRPLWIVFKRDMVIKLEQELIMNSFKTIDARGVNVCRHGYFHVVNNDYTHWQMYAIGGSADPTINSQGNRYLAPRNPYAKQVTKRLDTTGTWKQWNWRSEGDLLLNGAYFSQTGTRASSNYARASSLSAKSSSMVASVTASAGALTCRRGVRC
ncbi:hypothetical protein ACFE04_030699 [Oxalis oulophora]